MRLANNTGQTKSSHVNREPGTCQKSRGEQRSKQKVSGGTPTMKSVKTEGPYVHGHQFVVRFSMDITPKGESRMTMDEVGLYTVMEGKIVEERFFYGT
jgi:hypothetical protein